MFKHIKYLMYEPEKYSATHLKPITYTVTSRRRLVLSVIYAASIVRRPVTEIIKWKRNIRCQNYQFPSPV